MAEVNIKIKHQGTIYDVVVDTSADGETLKTQLFSLTNVLPEHQKILAKKVVKDDTPLSSLNLKNGMTINMLGNPSTSSEAMEIEAPKRMKFAEDMTEAELAQQEGATPAGLQNTGNTCYANSTLQTLRAIPELQDHLKLYTTPEATAGSSQLFSAQQLASVGLGGLGAGSDLTASLRDLFKQLSETQTGFPPIMFLSVLRNKFPQFNEKAKNGHGFAQQDAEEVWTNLVQVLRESLKLENDEDGFKTWIDKYMGGKYEVTTTCDEAPEEAATVTQDEFQSLYCNITAEINHLREGLKLALNESIEKNSPTLGRSANYTKISRISRLPKWLPIQLVRFFWRKDTKKKAKILRKVTFQPEIDLTEFCTDELRKKLVPVRDQVREVRKEEEDVERAKKRQKRMREQEAAAGEESAVRTDEPLQKKKEKEKERELKASGPDTEAELDKEKLAAGGTQDIPMAGTEETFKTDEEIEKERAESILTAKKELLGLVHDDMKKDPTANQTGLYELRGVITHQGSSADSGHYTAYIKKTAPAGKVEDGKWWWFNDEKVSEVEAEKIETLTGGGESHSGLILLYKAVELPVVPTS